MELKNIIIDRMKELNINNEELAKRMNVAPSTTSRYISGDITNIRRDKIKKLADALQIDVSYLMGWKEYNNNQSKTFVEDKEIARWIGKLMREDDPDIHELLKIISALDTNDVKALLPIVRALKKRD